MGKGTGGAGSQPELQGEVRLLILRISGIHVHHAPSGFPTESVDGNGWSRMCTSTDVSVVRMVPTLESTLGNVHGVCIYMFLPWRYHLEAVHITFVPALVHFLKRADMPQKWSRLYELSRTCALIYICTIPCELENHSETGRLILSSCPNGLWYYNTP